MGGIFTRTLFNECTFEKTRRGGGGGGGGRDGRRVIKKKKHRHFTLEFQDTILTWPTQSPQQGGLGKPPRLIPNPSTTPIPHPRGGSAPCLPTLPPFVSLVWRVSKGGALERCVDKGAQFKGKEWRVDGNGGQYGVSQRSHRPFRS